MILHVIEAAYAHDYVIHVKFNDGADGYVDLSGELHGEMFAPLKDMKRFRGFKVDTDLNTIVWENGADLAPEFLHDRLLVPAENAPESEDDKAGA